MFAERYKAEQRKPRCGDRGQGRVQSKAAQVIQDDGYKCTGVKEGEAKSLRHLEARLQWSVEGHHMAVMGELGTVA